VAGWDPTLPPSPPADPDRGPVMSAGQRSVDPKQVRSIPVTPQAPPSPGQPPKKGFFGRIRDLFK
jgi:hypothetical protein